MRPDERQALSLLAHVLMHGGQGEKAMALLDGLDALLPAEPATLRSLAVAQLRAGHPEPALQTLARLAPLGEDPALLALLRAQALVAAGRRPEAEQAMREFLQYRGGAGRGEGGGEAGTDAGPDVRDEGAQPEEARP